MGRPPKPLDFTRPIATRGGSEIKFYEVFDGRYINGAYYEQSEDVWYPCSWGSDGKYGDKPCSLDLINIVSYVPEVA
jgi:hypothetical protein